MEFKVGDRIIYDNDVWYKRGTVLTVVDIDESDNHMPYRVTDGNLRLWIPSDNLKLKSKGDLQQNAIDEIAGVLNDYHHAGTLSEEMALAEIESILTKYYAEVTG